MKILLYLLTVVCFITPIMFWVYAAAMACAFVTSAGACGVTLSDFLKAEFFEVAVVPWCLAIICCVFARRSGRRSE